VTITLVTERKQLTALNVPIEVSAVVVLGDPKRPLYVLPIEQLREVLTLYDDMERKDDPCSGGFVEVPSNVGAAHVLLITNEWRLRAELTDTDVIRDFGGCAQLGSGQLVPIETARLSAPPAPTGTTPPSD
jgi:hypothetical protein